jgi:hypothetical protein
MYFASRIAPGARANLHMSDRLRALHAVFFAGDTDHSGGLSLREFVGGIRPIVGTLTGAEEQFLFDAFDFTKNRQIDLAEFDFALFRDVQTTGDSADVRKVISDVLLRKLAAFRALAPGEHGNSGSQVDDNVVDLQQKRVKEVQKKGQGLVAALALVLSSKTGVLSALGIAAMVAGIVLGILRGDTTFFKFVLAPGYVLYLVASFMGHDFALLGNAVSGAEGLAAQFDPVYRANAKFRWHIECYHYENRTRRDSKGHTHTERVRVTTYTATHEGLLRSFEVSPPFVPSADSFVLTQVISSARVQVRFPEYFHARDSWRAANSRDTHQDFSAAEFIPGLRPEVLVEYVPGARPRWMTRWVFALATLLLGSLLFKVAFNARCGRQHYIFVKDVVAFTEDPECEEARMYDEEKRAGLANAVYAPALPQVVVIPAAAAGAAYAQAQPFPPPPPLSAQEGAPAPAEVVLAAKEHDAPSC